MDRRDTPGTSGLANVLRHALLEIRYLCRKEKAAQAADLVDAVHNMPTGIGRTDFNHERVREELVAYRDKYADTDTPPLFDYDALLNDR